MTKKANTPNKVFTPQFSAKDGSFYLGYIASEISQNDRLVERYTGHGENGKFADNPIRMPKNLSGRTKDESPTSEDVTTLIESMYGVSGKEAEKLATLMLWNTLRGVLTQSAQPYFDAPEAAMQPAVMAAFATGDIERIQKLKAEANELIESAFWPENEGSENEEAKA